MSLRRKKTVACPKCNKESDYLFWESLNGDLDPEAKAVMSRIQGLSIGIVIVTTILLFLRVVLVLYISGAG